MTPLLPEPEPKGDGDRKLLADVREYGLHVIHIPPRSGTPGWSFSVGLFRTRRSPEVVVFGLAQDVAHAVVNGLGRRAATAPLEPDQVHGGLIEGFDCVLKPVQAAWYRLSLGYANWYYRRCPFPVLQCVWPDRASRFPWNPHFSDASRWAQPLLHLSDPGEARVETLLKSMGIDPAG